MGCRPTPEGYNDAGREHFEANRHLVLENNVPKRCKQAVVRIQVRNSNLQGVNDTWNVTEDRKEDVDQEIGTASALKEHTKRWEDDGKNDLADVAGASQYRPSQNTSRKAVLPRLSGHPVRMDLPSSESHCE